MSRKISLIIIHCSATRRNQRFTVAMLKKCHDARFHGKGIAYHYYIEKDGQVYQTRDEEEIGMHARHYNAHSIGICYEGGLDENGVDKDTRTQQMMISLRSRYGKNAVFKGIDLEDCATALERNMQIGGHRK